MYSTSNKKRGPFLQIPVDAIDSSFFDKVGIGESFNQKDYTVALSYRSFYEGRKIWTELYDENEKLCATLLHFTKSEFYKLIISKEWKKEFIKAVL